MVVLKGKKLYISIICNSLVYSNISFSFKNAYYWNTCNQTHLFHFFLFPSCVFHVSRYLYACVWKHKVHICCLSWLLPILYVEARSLKQTQNIPIWLFSLVSLFWGSPWFWLQLPVITLITVAQLFLWVPYIKTKILILAPEPFPQSHFCNV